MDKTNSLIIGSFSQCVDIIIQEHEPTKSAFRMIREGMLKFTELLQDKSDGEALVVQTGSSYDGLHLSRLLQSTSGKHIFYPSIDFDFMMIYRKYEILDQSSATTDLQETLQSSKEFAVMIHGSYTGYVRLAITNHGREMIQRPKCDFQEFITTDGYIPNFIFKTKLFPDHYQDAEVLYQREAPKYTSSGPALSDFTPEQTTGHSYDFVHTFPCKTWPGVALNWTRRPRPTGWPSKELVLSITKDGCAVVPVGHHLSETPDLEWRISFNAAERELSHSLTQRQKSCYTFVKFLLKTGLRPSCILTSYHVKNMMFWYCEQMYGEEEWTDELQGERIITFLDYIANALENKSVPNYFLPSNNMIAHRTSTEIEQTRKEVLLVKDRIFQTLLLTLTKLQCLDEVKGATSQGEVQTMLTIYTVFVQILYKNGFLNLSQLTFSERCFGSVVRLNRCVRNYVRTASAAFSAQSICELLKPFAIAYTQSEDVDNALAVYQLMLRSEESLVIAEYKETFTNLGCLYNLKFKQESEEGKKNEFIEKAESSFKTAVRIIDDSPSLHLAYGNCLLDTKRISAAMEQFKLSLKITRARDDDQALIQIMIPSKQETKTKMAYVSGQIAAGYILCDCFMKLDEQYEARKTANRLTSIVVSSTLRFRHDELLVCAMALTRCGLDVKAELNRNEASKYKDLK
ncbi:hypothetical protein FSP39_004526 [Pinctada imbricata]|uniref:Mab-21-like HhH/H2TH-like domain-containing protein n=1 Tax=Pinctada imbricata TaxID=66713 RepID=A0AA88Y4V1_PINIB|nr:hypothetical protein FSP39_004526 [Pinctada imbricata]